VRVRDVVSGEISGVLAWITIFWKIDVLDIGFTQRGQRRLKPQRVHRRDHGECAEKSPKNNPNKSIKN